MIELKQHLTFPSHFKQYRTMKACLDRHSSDMASIIQSVLDPEGVEARRNHRLRRRIYLNDGSNFLIHIDGYDKRKRFGFAVHGPIDGFSRRGSWDGRSNNKPEIVASNFVNYLQEIQGVPRCIRIYAGTENTLIADIQVALREQHMAGDRSVIVGYSPRTQADMNNHREDWNQHRIRQCSKRETLGGKPDMMFFVPSLYDSEDYKSSVIHQDLQDVCEAFCEIQTPNRCEREFSALCSEVMGLHRKSQPTNHVEAFSLFTWLINRF